MKRISLVPVALSFLVLAGCKSTPSHLDKQVSMYHDGGFGKNDGPLGAQSQNKNGRQDSTARAGVTDRELLEAVLDVTERGLAESVATRRRPPGVKHDSNDEVEAMLYSVAARFVIRAIREVLIGSR